MSSNSSRPGFVLKRRGLPSNHGLNSKSNLQDGMETTTTSKGSTFSSTKSSSIAYAHFSLQNQEIVSRQMPSDSSVSTSPTDFNLFLRFACTLVKAEVKIIYNHTIRLMK
jgi:hypothetical protein